MKVSVLSVPLWSTYNKWLVWRHHAQECGDSTHKIWHNCKSKNEALTGLSRKKCLFKKWLRIEIYKYQRTIYIFKLKINIYFLYIIQLTPTYNNCLNDQQYNSYKCWWDSVRNVTSVLLLWRSICANSTHLSVCHPLLTYTYSGFIFILFYKATKRLDYMKHRLQDTSVWYKFLPCTQYPVQNLHDIQQASLLEKTPFLYISTFFFTHHE